MNRGEDRDDWFAGAEPEGRQAPDDAGEEGVREDWLQARDPPSPRPWLAILDRRVLVPAAVGITLLIAVLVAAGVFSSGPGTPVPAVTSTPTATTSTSTTQPPAAPQVKPVPAPTTSLKPGDTGTQVKVLQRALVSLGYSIGTIDGQYGPTTEAAVKSFQGVARLTADGLVGPATLRALATALRGT